VNRSVGKKAHLDRPDKKQCSSFGQLTNKSVALHAINKKHSMLVGASVRWMKLLLASLWPCALTITVCFVRTVPDVAPDNHRRKMRRNIVRRLKPGSTKAKQLSSRDARLPPVAPRLRTRIP